MRCLSPEECSQWRDASSRRRHWKRQLTCETPLDRLAWFSAALVDHLAPFDECLLIIDKLVFGEDPPALKSIRLAIGESRTIHKAPGHWFGADPAGLREALEAALSEWVDFSVLLSPSRHALRADHDEYTTFFSESSGKIAEVRRVVEGERVPIAEYVAPAP